MGINNCWDSFRVQALKCYELQENGQNDKECWYKAFTLLMEAILTERSINPEFASELEEIDEQTYYKYNVTDWVYDYLDVLDLVQEYEKLYSDGSRIINEFEWKRNSCSQIKLQVAHALEMMGMNQEAIKYCEDWIAEKRYNMDAILSLYCAMRNAGKYDDAANLVKKYIADKRFFSQKYLSPDDKELIYMIAEEAFELTHDSQALKELKIFMKMREI